MDHTRHRRVADFVWCVARAALAACAPTMLPLAAAIVPELPRDPRVAGFAFPESEAALTRWITEMSRADTAVAAAAFEKIHLHGWGLWAAVTAETAQAYDGRKLRIFETWLTLDDLLEPRVTAATEPAARAVRPAPLRRLAGLELPGPHRELRLAAASAPSIDRLMGFVKFDPVAAVHIEHQQLLERAALDVLLDAGATQIPPFPAAALAVKPLFQLIRAKDLVAGRYHALKAWSGPPSTPRPWAPAHWPGVVWIDLANGGTGDGSLDPIALADGSTRTDATTYPLSSLLHHRLSATDAAALNGDPALAPVSPGDIALLVAMHISSRETARWTWQTYWWTPSPDAPAAPSSAAIASLRPPELRGAVRHYAMALAYIMLSPDQPYVGGENATPAVYAYNPYLEAKLAPADLPDSVAGFAPDGRPAANNHGVQTNCMSCHARANYNPRQRHTAPGFSGARYVDLGAADFVGTLQVDFLWSLARHAR